MYDIVVGRSKADREKFGTKGTILLGKQFVQMGQTQTLANKIYMDIASAHVVFICGKRGGGKCLTGDTLITLSDGSLVPIRELAANDQDILCLNNNLKMQTMPKTEFFKRTVPKTLNLTLRSGKTITLTPEHPLLTLGGWQNAENLSIGSRIATPRIEPVFGEKDMSESEVKLLAYFIAEGHIAKGKTWFTNTDDQIIDDFISGVRAVDNAVQIKRNGVTLRVVSDQVKRSTQIERRNAKGQIMGSKVIIDHHKIRLLLEKTKIFGKSSGDKVIPECICTLPKHKLSLFLNRLFSCDGSIYVKKNKKSKQWIIEYSSKSRTMIQQLQLLLARFGIQSHVKTKQSKKYTNYSLLLYGSNVYAFLQDIGFYGKKIERQQLALTETPKKHNPNLDTLPKEIWQSFKPENWAKVGRKMGYAYPKAMRESIRYAPSRDKMLQIAQIIQNHDLIALAQSDIYWDEIIAIDQHNDETEVYDISVPEFHNFVANGIIVHNSYTMGVIAEGLADIDPEIKNKISIILLDTMGVYWTMKYGNKKDEALLEEWGLKPKGLDVQIYTPSGAYKEFKAQGIPTDFPFSILPSELSADDWRLTLNLKEHDEIAVLLERVINMLQESERENYTIQDMITCAKGLKEFSSVTVNALINELENTKKWGLFGSDGTKLKDLAVGGQITVLDLSCYATQANGWNIKSLVVGLLSQKIFIERMVSRRKEEFASVYSAMHYFSSGNDEKTKDELPLVWLVIDEAHEFLPAQGKTSASDALITLLREGRQPGVSLILATQQPGKIHSDVMTQCDTVIGHRITAKPDVDALGTLMQSYMREGMVEQLDAMPRLQGAAIIFDDTNERLFPMRVRPRMTWHGGGSPTAMPKKKDYGL